jgi:hypothetical protein
MEFRLLLAAESYHAALRVRLVGQVAAVYIASLFIVAATIEKNKRGER